MGQKVSPNGLRFGINKQWVSRWNAKDNKETARWLVEDEKVRLYFLNKHKNAGIEKVEIERFSSVNTSNFTAFVYVAQPGIILGKENKVDAIKRDLSRIVGKKTLIELQIKQVANPEVSARLIAREIADGIERRISFRSAQKMGIRKALQGGAKGIKTKVSGRLGGAEIARDEGYSEGVVPLSTLRADIDYAFEIAKTTYGVIGVKVWINRGLYFGKGFMPNPEAPAHRRNHSDRKFSNRNDRKGNSKHKSHHHSGGQKSFKPTTKANS